MVQGLTVIVKTTHDCNLECKYCLTNPAAEHGRIDEETLKNMIVKISDYNKRTGSPKTSFIWHGGEPLLLGVDFYRKAVEIQKTIDHKFKNDVQSNGLLVGDYLDFFEQNKFHVGMSLDGPAFIQNMMRPKKGGLPSFDETINVLKELKKRKIGGGVICILNKTTIAHLEEIYSCFKEHSIDHKLNIQLPIGRALVNSQFDITPVEAGKALIKYFDMWFYDSSEPVLPVDPFDEILHNLGASRNKRVQVDYPIGCTYRNNCANTFISVVPGGNVYPCGRFAGTPGFLMGNINTNSMDEIMASEAHKLLLRRHEEGVPGCKPCRYNSICNSGCPDNALIYNGDMMLKDGHCAAHKMLFGHIEKALEKELEHVGTKQS